MGFNATFRVDSERGSFALRLNVNSKKTLAEMKAEIAWVRALGESTNVRVPKPVANTQNSFITEVLWEEQERTLNAVLYGWIEGTPGRVKPTIKSIFKLGAAAREFHRQAQGWELPNGASIRIHSDILGGASNRLSPHFDSRLLEEALKRGNDALRRLASEPPHAIHMDLHLSNVIRTRHGIAIIDFDDMAMGWPLLDIAVSLFYLRRFDKDGTLERKLFEGYGMKPEELGSNEDLEALIAGRALFLGNELLVSETNELKEMIPKYLEATGARLQRYLETGLFSR